MRQLYRVLFLLLPLGLAGACGDKIVIIECPLGTMPSASKCIPYEGPDADTSSASDLPVWDSVVAGDTSSIKDGVSDGDSGGAPDTTPPLLSNIGEACFTDADCGAEMTCIGWGDGFCGLLDCDMNACPAGSSCVLLPGGNTGCLAECLKGEPCPNPIATSCKPVVLADGSDTSAWGCLGVKNDAGDIGSPCGDTSDCVGAATCEALTSSGYCTELACKLGTCPSGAACVDHGGQLLCLRTCETDAGCEQTDTAPQECSPETGADGDELNVCVPAMGDGPTGSSCVVDLDCASGACDILGQGRCSQAGIPCDADDGCPDVEFCNISPASVVGVCTAACAVSMPCVGLGVCVAGLNLSDGKCRSPCSSAEDASCLVTDGLGCVFGYPLGAANGSYVCVGQEVGSAGAACTDHTQCQSGHCYAGSCSMPCGTNYLCPFPASCAMTPTEELKCLRACMGSQDCPDQATCALPPGGNKKVCVKAP
jgi:hypothetical protein